MNDTIYALATPLGAGIAIMRLSGPNAFRALEELFSHRGEYEARKLYYGKLIFDGKLIDEAMAVYMPGPNSYTGEDTVEFHCHGSAAVAKTLMSALSQMGFRLADPGEFSRRAFENGKMDLAQAEAVMDLIQAEAQRTADAALSQLQGQLSERIALSQDTLTDAIAQLEAFLDYPEEDWDENASAEVKASLSKVRDDIEGLLNNANEGRLLRDGLRVVLLGRPNVGKSTLFNTLLGHNRAIVSQHAGTTRDLLDEAVQIEGYPVRLIDTAGLRDSADEVEKIGIAMSRSQMDKADLLLFLLDRSEALNEEDLALLQESKLKKRLILLSKSDLPPLWDIGDLPLNQGEQVLSVSAKEQEGLNELLEAIAAQFSGLRHAGDSILLTNQRHIDACKRAVASLNDAIDAFGLNDMDCVSIDARAAWQALGEIAGTTLDETIIDRIFERFCLGK